MKNTIELKNSFEEYAVNELVNKLRELEPEDYESLNGEHIEVADLMDLLLEDKYVNGRYYIYTGDSEKVFKKYFNDILFICDRFGYADGEPINLDASNLLMVAIKHVFEALLETTVTSYTKLTRADLDKIAGRIKIASVTHYNLTKLIFD